MIIYLKGHHNDINQQILHQTDKPLALLNK